MEQSPKYYIVEASALPEIFQKVAEAKRMLETGVLSEILAIFANCGANILTINQSIPTGGRAMVTISAETSNLSCTLEALTQKIAERKGVVKADCVAG